MVTIFDSAAARKINPAFGLILTPEEEDRLYDEWAAESYATDCLCRGLSPAEMA